jgi:hypothetical protein
MLQHTQIFSLQPNFQLSTEHARFHHHLPTAEISIQFSNANTNYFVASLLSYLRRAQLSTASSHLTQLFQLAWDPRYMSSGKTEQKTPFCNNPFIFACILDAAGTCLPSRCLAMIIYFSLTISASRRHFALCIIKYTCTSTILSSFIFN